MIIAWYTKDTVP